MEFRRRYSRMLEMWPIVCILSIAAVLSIFLHVTPVPMSIRPLPVMKSFYNVSTSFLRLQQPERNFVYIKIEKTGGSTLATLTFRYGLKNNLVAAVSHNYDPHIYIRDDKMKIHEYSCDNFPGYNYVANHIMHYRNGRLALKKVFKDAKYFTMLRSPITRTKSAFYFFKSLHKNYTEYPNPFETFLKLYSENKGARLDGTIFNYQFNEFFGIPDNLDDTVIENMLVELNRELDLVMITEYFDESLVLLRKMMGWDFEDMVYSSRKVRGGTQPPLTPEMAEIIRKFSPLDLKIYEYFNTTFWERVKNYDGDFEEDLTRLRNTQSNATQYCQTNQQSDYCQRLKLDTPKIMRVAIEHQKKWDC